MSFAVNWNTFQLCQKPDGFLVEDNIGVCVYTNCSS